MIDSPASRPDDLDDLASPQSIAWALGGVLVGVAFALVVLPDVVPPLARALSSPQPRTWWHLSRASGLVAYGLLEASMLLGLLLSTRFAKTWPGTATAFALHEHASTLGLAFATFHALVLLGDRHTPFALAQLALPFGAAYRPLAVGAGQLAVYGSALLVGSFYVRKRIGQRAWRLVHFASFLVFALTLAHALAAGTDQVVVLVGSVPIAALLFFATYRLLARVATIASQP
jgi:predicted ferric reductase